MSLDLGVIKYGDAHEKANAVAADLMKRASSAGGPSLSLHFREQAFAVSTALKQRADLIDEVERLRLEIRELRNQLNAAAIVAAAGGGEA